MRPEDIKYYSEFLNEFQKESDRGAALVGAALLDKKLANILAAYLKKHKTSKELLGVNGPLGSFSARINISNSVGLISDYEYHELEIIRKVRNEFAHSLHGVSFTTPKIKSLCKNFVSDTPGDISDNPRMLFINAVICTSLGLFYRPELIEVNRKKVNISS